MSDAPPKAFRGRVLVIAGSDSGGGAGIQADIKTVTMLGGHAMTAITAITAQNTLGVQAVHAVPPEMVIAQIDSVVGDIGVDAVKIGMIGSAETARAVAERLARLDGVPIVFDPVMVATSGSVLADGATVEAFEALLRISTVATPNLDELRALSGMPVSDELAIGDAAGILLDRFGGALLATGFPLPSDATLIRDDGAVVSIAGHLLDQLFLLNRDEGYFREYGWHAARIDTDQDHGTGCTLASAIATGLGQGMSLPDSIVRARAYVRAGLELAPGFGAGHGPMGVPRDVR